MRQIFFSLAFAAALFLSVPVFAHDPIVIDRAASIPEAASITAPPYAEASGTSLEDTLNDLAKDTEEINARIRDEFFKAFRDQLSKLSREERLGVLEGLERSKKDIMRQRQEQLDYLDTLKTMIEEYNRKNPQ